MRIAPLLPGVFLALLTSGVVAEPPDGSLYSDGGTSRIALILAHGRGKHPGWLVVDPLRIGVHERLGYHTLSLQMPNPATDWRAYAATFPAAHAAIQDGIRFLREDRKVSTIFLMGHSMGGRMTSAFVSENPDQPLAGLIVAGCRNNGGSPLSCVGNLEGIRIRVLDIWGGGSSKDAAAAASRKALRSESYRQIEIAGANHRFEGHEEDLVNAVTQWLEARP